MKFPQGLLVVLICWTGAIQADVIHDKARNRQIPIHISYPLNKERCTIEQKCPVALISAGYGVSHTKYSFLSNPLTELGYMAVSIAHELPQDPPLSVKGNLYETRSENWTRGATTLDFIRHELASRYLNYEFDDLLLVGHSNGGDISAWLGNEGKPYVRTIITLDHRRVPLPRTEAIRILSIRGSDFPADKGVLPTSEENAIFPICVRSIPESKHNDMTDDGPDWLKKIISTLLKEYLNGATCKPQANQPIDFPQAPPLSTTPNRHKG